MDMKNIIRSKANFSGIYCIINLVNSKIYIGSSYSIYKRLRDHLSFLRSNKHNNQHLQNSFNKRGEDNFYSIILEECNVDDLAIREEYWINLLKADYNKVFTDLTRPSANMSIELRSQISNSVKEAHKNGLLSSNRKNVFVYNLKGEFYKEYRSVIECSKDLGIHRTDVSGTLNNRYIQFKGYQFRYSYSENIESIEHLVIYNKQGKIKKINI